MKFKAVLGAPQQLSKLIQTLDKLADTCVVHLTPDLLRFGVLSEGRDSLNLHVSCDVSQACAAAAPPRRHPDTSAPRPPCRRRCPRPFACPQKTVFLDYMVQSKAENNRISFFVKIENLSRALRSCCSSNSEHVQLKLTKKLGQPALSFEIHETSVQVLHEVPIRIVTDVRETHQYTEPPVGDNSDAAIAVIFPAKEFKGLKNVVERMKSVHDWMRLTASRGPQLPGDVGGGGEIDGGGTAELQLLVEKPELVRIKTTYPKLGVPTAAPSEDDEAEGGGAAVAGVDATGGAAACDAPAAAPAALLSRTASASVEIKKLLRVLQSLSASDLKIQNAIVCVVPGSMVILKIYLPDVNQESFMIYYLPVMADPDD